MLDLLRRRRPAVASAAIAMPCTRPARVGQLAAAVVTACVALVVAPGTSHADDAPGGSIYFAESKAITAVATIGSAVLAGGKR